MLGGHPAPRPLHVISPRLNRPRARKAVADYSGAATVEAYTVPYARDGTAEAVIVSALTPDGARALARGSDPDLVQALLDQDPLGAEATIAAGTIEELS